MSRPHLIKLLNQGAFSSTRVGEQRRLKLAEVLEHQDRQQRESEVRLRELLVPAILFDVLLRTAIAGLYRAHWSDDIY